MGAINLTGTFDTGQYAPTLNYGQQVKIHLAGLAMQGIMARLDAGILSEEETAEKAFRVADAMISAASKRGLYP
jgi:hypothetical protein